MHFLLSCKVNAANISTLQSGRLCTTIREIYHPKFAERQSFHQRGICFTCSSKHGKIVGFEMLNGGNIGEVCGSTTCLLSDKSLLSSDDVIHLFFSELTVLKEIFKWCYNKPHLTEGFVCFQGTFCRIRAILQLW